MKENLKVLLIEDDMDDVELLKEAFGDNKVQYEMEIIMEGDRVKPFLQNAEFIPSIIIMDLNLPKTDGKEILKDIKSTDAFKTIPLIVFSTSSSKEDIEYAYTLGANKFITKPTTIAGWNETIEIIVHLATTYTATNESLMSDN
jgi:DNA-binding response OmpR family regulator